MQFFIRLGAVNLLLVSVYLVPLWSRDALRVLCSPFGGLHDPPHAFVVDFFRGYLGLGIDGMLVLSNVLAGFKLLAVAAMVAFLVEFVRAIAERREPDRETSDAALALTFVSIITFAPPLLAIDDRDLVRSSAAQLMLVCGAVVVTLVEREIEGRRLRKRVSTPPLREEPAEQRLAA